uniref:Solute carrier family 2, facilitated glucose transporter member 10 n=1 Tax=Amphilophus citrinellus TaxID=61819 RepID=A0A3Q0QU07_AMPCI
MSCPITLLASVVSTLGGLVFGYELGIISGALLQLKADFRLSCIQQEAVVSSLLIGALLASIVGGYLIDRHGCRNSILLSNVLILMASLVLLINSFLALIVGRITIGFAICLSSMSCCIFVSEMVSPDRRGFLVTLYEAGITVGILSAYAMNYILSGSKKGWKWMFGLAVVPTLVQLLSIWFLPSTAKDSYNQSHSFQNERGFMSTTEAPEEDESKVHSSKDNKKDQDSSLYLFKREDNMRTRTAIGLGLVLFQQFTGQPNILFYASTVFHAVGFQSNPSAVLASVGLGLVKVIATLISMVFSDRLGRRPLLIGGCSVMALCLITIGLLSGHSQVNSMTPCNSQNIDFNTTHALQSPAGNESVFDMSLVGSYSLFKNTTQDEDAVFNKISHISLEPAPESFPKVRGRVVNWIVLVCMMAIVSAYSVGFGPMTWLVLSEIFPAAIRGRAFAFTSCFNWAANLLVTFTFLNVIDVIGLSGMFLVYGLTAVAAAVFFYVMLPETKGKTLEEIDKELRLHRNTSPQYQRVRCHVSTSG